MKLRDEEWGHVFNASGARGFEGEGYWFHKPWKHLGLSYEGSTFVAKTTTLMPRPGNMKLDAQNRPSDLFPDCIVVKPFAGVVLNSVGLSGPGTQALVERWKKNSPGKFVISVMSIAPTPETRIQEAKAIFTMLEPMVERYDDNDPGPKLALQINFSCPNIGIDTSHLVHEAVDVLNASQKLGLPTMVKLNALVLPWVARDIMEHPACDAIVMSNTIPWGQLDHRIDWKGLFGSETSPIAKYGGGGLSGKPLLAIVNDWIYKARAAGLKKPIVGGGGILCAEDAGKVLDAGASAVELGSVAILRPWRVQSIIKYVNRRLGAKG